MAKRKNTEEEASSTKPRIIRIFLTPIQEAQLEDLRYQTGVSEAENMRRFIDEGLRTLIKNGEYIPSRSATAAEVTRRLREEKDAKDGYKPKIAEVGEDL